MNRIVFAACLLVLALGLAIPSFAAKGGDASAFVQKLSDTAISVLTKPDMDQAERDRRFSNLLNQNFDVPAIGRFVLGRYWRVATTEQQQEYLRLFERAIVNTYSARFAKYSGQKLEVQDSRAETDTILVRSRMVSPDGSEPVSIDWRLKQAGGDYRIIDVIVEGVSMSTTQRSEYGSVIERNGGEIEALLKALRKKTGIISVSQ